MIINVYKTNSFLFVNPIFITFVSHISRVSFDLFENLRRKFTQKNVQMTIECLETVDFELVLLDQASFREELTDVFALVALKLKNFSVFWMFDYSTIAGEFLESHKESQIFELRASTS